MKNNEIKITDIWNEEKTKSLSEFIVHHSDKQTKEQKLRNELLSIQYQIEDYIRSDSTDRSSQSERKLKPVRLKFSKVEFVTSTSSKLLLTLLPFV